MAKKTQGIKARPGSLRSQKNIQAQWRLESSLKTCNAQIALWERKLAAAQEGITRNTAQIAAGQGIAHLILESHVQDAGKAREMISSFKMQAAALQSEMDALMPNAAKAAERAGAQKILAGQFLLRLEIDRKLDSALEAVRQILWGREALTSKMREGALSLEFDHGINLDDGRFEALLRILPEKMAVESERFVDWFLGQDGERKPCEIHGGEFVLRETLASHNAFRTGDCPNLTKEEADKIEREWASRGPFAVAVEAPPRRLGQGAEEVRPENIQWMLVR